MVNSTSNATNKRPVRAGRALSRTGEQGFSLIELLVAIMIFSIGIMAVASMQGNALGSGHDSRKMSGVTEKAMDAMEMLISLPYNDARLVAGNFAPANAADGMDNDDDGVTDEAGETGDYTLSWTVQDNTPFPNSRTIAVTVSSVSANKQVTLTGMVSRN